jgi:hypothetical protein
MRLDRPLGEDALDNPSYGPPFLDQDLRRLNDAALDLLWRVSPEVMVPSPDWLQAFLNTNVHHSAWELMCKLLLILNEVSEIEVSGTQRNGPIVKGRLRKTGYPLRYVEDDLLDMQRALTELSQRLRRRGCRKIGPEIPGRRLRWLAEGAIARAEPILDAVREQGDAARQNAGSDILAHDRAPQWRH